MKKRFTLTEILVVVFLIGVLTVIGFGMYGYAMNSGREKATRSLIARIEAALESCNTKFGYIPTSIPSSSTTPAFNTIKITVGSNGEITVVDFNGKKFQSSVDKDKDYLKEFLQVIDAEALKGSVNSSSGELEDSWGNTIYYAYPGRFNKTSYDLYSAGADGRVGKNNAELSTTTLNGAAVGIFKDTSDNSMLCDDIINF
ncbi:hypothetical protein SDC9_112178 [bioreactor metagenome]|uniref:Type II secretion system protein GspG C-terminal domain-containing protein n=1 Tax=bioreactor metagenome TaxID=1076179 RepID=A0A645BPY9_9ZZZZ